MRTIGLILLCLTLTACQASGTSNGRSSNANFMASILTLEF